jgi:hypothetical protein
MWSRQGSTKAMTRGQQLVVVGAWLVFVTIVIVQWTWLGLFVPPLSSFYVAVVLVAAPGIFRAHPLAIAVVEVASYVSILLCGCPPPDTAHHFSGLTENGIVAGVTSSWLALTVMAIAMRYVRRTTVSPPAPPAPHPQT